MWLYHALCYLIIHTIGIYVLTISFYTGCLLVAKCTVYLCTYSCLLRNVCLQLGALLLTGHNYLCSILTIFDPNALQLVALIVGYELVYERRDRLTRHGREHSAACCSLLVLKLTD